MKKTTKTIKPKTYKYTVEMKFNGETFTKQTNNIKEAILSIKPDFVHTEGYITITSGGLLFQRMLPLIKIRKLFRDPDDLEIFTSTLIF